MIMLLKVFLLITFTGVLASGSYHYYHNILPKTVEKEIRKRAYKNGVYHGQIRAIFYDETSDMFLVNINEHNYFVENIVVETKDGHKVFLREGQSIFYGYYRPKNSVEERDMLYVYSV